jgi:hypothetical protein
MLQSRKEKEWWAMKEKVRRVQWKRAGVHKKAVGGVWNTVLLKSIRQSRVTRVLDVTNFGTLSRVTEALDEYTFCHGWFKIWALGCSEQVSLAADTLPTIFSPFSRFPASNLTNIMLQTKFNQSSTVKWIFFLFNRFAEIKLLR